MRALLALLVVVLAISAAGCATSPKNPRAFLADPALRQRRAIPTPDERSPSSTPASPIKVARGGNGSGQSTVSGLPPALAFIDAGHGGVDVGTQGSGPDGQSVYEKTVSLAIAIKVSQILRQEGISVVLSRSDDSLPESTPADFTPDGRLVTPEGILHDLQRRIDRANASGAIVMLSIHLNGYTDPAVGGSETFYDVDRTFADDNRRFAGLVQAAVVSTLRDAGYAVVDRGTTNDSSLESDGFGTLGAPYRHLILLGPAVPGKLRPSQMPGALSEPLFLSNPIEAGLAIQPDIQQALARAYASAIEQFLRS